MAANVNVFETSKKYCILSKSHFSFADMGTLRKHQKIEAKNTRKTKSKRRNRKIFLLPDEIIQRSERKMKVGNYFEINCFSTVLI